MFQPVLMSALKPFISGGFSRICVKYNTACIIVCIISQRCDMFPAWHATKRLRGAFVIMELYNVNWLNLYITKEKL